MAIDMPGIHQDVPLAPLQPSKLADIQIMIAADDQDAGEVDRPLTELIRHQVAFLVIPYQVEPVYDLIEPVAKPCGQLTATFAAEEDAGRLRILELDQAVGAVVSITGDQIRPVTAQ